MGVLVAENAPAPRGAPLRDGAYNFGTAAGQRMTRGMPASTLREAIAAIYQPIFADAMGWRIPPPDAGNIDRNAAPAVARVDSGRWIADCPAASCGGAEFVWFDSPVFFCLSCGNVAVAGKWRVVELPAPVELDAIDRTLRERDDVRSRNWHPRESVLDLLIENVARGAPLPAGVTVEEMPRAEIERIGRELGRVA